MHSREQPWNLRHISAVEEAAFQRVRIWASLTQAWYTALSRGDADTKIFIEQPFSQHLRAETPWEALGRIEHIVWAEQIKLLEQLQPGKRSDGAVAEGTLEQAAWTHGFNFGKTVFSGSGLALMKYFSDWLQSLSDTSLSRPSRALVLRQTDRELQIEFGFCAHCLPGPKPIRDQLCKMKETWLRGFAYAASPVLTLANSAHSLEQDRPCYQRWTLDEPAKHS